MTPKEKAQELVLKYLRIENTNDWWSKVPAKQCALIAVDEIFKTGLLEGSTLGINKKYWQQVKTEIEKL
jgi:hypothetical protein